MLPTLLQKIDGVRPIDDIIKNLKTNKILILKARTGSGKSTILPAFLHNENKNKIILSVQPRVINAITLPQEIIKHYSFELGKNIGYHTGYFYRLPAYGIIFETIGTFLQKITTLTDEEICEKYHSIIIDEAHEVNTLALNVHYFIKSLYERLKDKVNCPRFVIASATLDAERFARYYKIKNIIDVPGNTFEIKNVFLKYNASDYIYKSAEIAAQICREQKGDILIFLPTTNAAAALSEILNKMIPEKLIIMQLNKQVIQESNNTKYVMMSAKTFKADRKIILSTNVAETGVTIPVKFVIDTGYANSAEYCPDFTTYSMFAKPISKNSAIQRRGRIGRTEPGEYWALFTEETFNALHDELSYFKEENTIDILFLIKQLSGYANLTYKNYRDTAPTQKINLYNTDLVYNISNFSMWRSVEKLYTLGFIKENHTLEISGLAAIFIKKLNIEQIKLIFSGYIWGAAISDLIVIALWIKTETIKYKAFQTPDLPIEDDFIKVLYMPIPDEILEERDEIIDCLAVAGLNPFENEQNALLKSKSPEHSFYILRQCIYEAYRNNVIYQYKTKCGLEISPKYIKSSAAFCYARLENRHGQIIPIGINPINYINRDFESYDVPFEKNIDLPAHKRLKLYNKLSFAIDPPQNSAQEYYRKILGEGETHHFLKISEPILNKIIKLNPKCAEAIIKGITARRDDSYFRRLKLKYKFKEFAYLTEQNIIAAPRAIIQYLGLKDPNIIKSPKIATENGKINIYSAVYRPEYDFFGIAYGNKKN
jgi:hypothetical protein